MPSSNVKSARRRRSGGASEVINSPRSFFIKTKTGKTAVMQRRGKKRGTARLMYVFAKAAQIKARFGFKATAIKVVRRQFVREMKKAMIRAIRTAR